MTKIFTIVDWYLPGYKAGGPTRTIVNLIELLGREFDFFVFTRDRDFGDTAPYPGLKTDEWEKVGAADVYYASNCSLANLRRRVKEIQPDILYLNSFFSRLTIKLLLLRRLRLIPESPVVLAPRGEFSSAALNIKKTRKKLFMDTAFRFLYRRILWLASTPTEELQIQQVLKRRGLKHTDVALARNVHLPVAAALARAEAKQPGKARFVFLSRISRMKNLKYAIDVCTRLRGDLSMDIYGPQEDAALWNECKRAIESAPANVQITYCGPLAPDRVSSTLAQYHFFLLPTLGENFGHVILEALAAGCPVIISDQTPWRDLKQKGAGWTLPLQDTQTWQETCQSCVDLDDERFVAMSNAAREFALKASDGAEAREENVNLFQRALSMRTSGEKTRVARVSAG